MRKINLKHFILLGLFTVFLGGCNDLSGDQIQISLSQSDYLIGIDEPVILDFVIKNNSDRIIDVDLGQNSKGGFTFTVVSPEGKETEIPRYEITNGISGTGEVIIRPRQMHSQKLFFNEWFNFDSPGVYTVRGKLFYPVKSGGKEIEEIPVFVAVLDVKPRNLERIKTTSAFLYGLALQSHGEPKRNYARALGYINDPVAVPYLKRLLIADKMLDSIAISGLTRIGGQKSIKVLNQIIRRIPFSDRAMLCRSALKRIEKQDSKLSASKQAPKPALIEH